MTSFNMKHDNKTQQWMSVPSRGQIMTNEITKISSFKRMHNDKFNNDTSDSKIELIAEAYVPESKRGKGANIILQEACDDKCNK